MKIVVQCTQNLLPSQDEFTQMLCDEISQSHVRSVEWHSPE